ncbi:MAG: tetratricopeptide repeat protein [Desulfovibrionales bacterium]
MKNIVLLLCLVLVSCSLPRVTLLDDPLTGQEHLQLGAAYEEQGEFELALREYKAAARSLPEGHLYGGNVLFQQGNLDAAVQAYSRAIRTMPEDPRPLNNLAWLYYTRGQNLDRALELATRAVELAPEGAKDPYLDTMEKIHLARQSQPEPPRP